MPYYCTHCKETFVGTTNICVYCGNEAKQTGNTEKPNEETNLEKMVRQGWESLIELKTYFQYIAEKGENDGRN